MNDETLARIVAVKMLLAAPTERDTILQTEIPFNRFHKVMPLIAGVMAGIMDDLLAHQKGFRGSVHSVLNKYLTDADK